MSRPLGNEQAVTEQDMVGMQRAHSMQGAGWYRGANDETLRCRETILLVEDEPFVQEVTREVLHSAGYEVLIAKNAAEAMESYNERNGEVDLLLTDVILPGVTGRMLAASLRRENPPLRVLYVTGYAEHMRMRADDLESCLPKPFSAEELLRRVRQILAQPRFVAGAESELRSFPVACSFENL